MNYNWNVYKLFKNGRRAKAPFYQLEGETKKEVKEKFLDEYLAELNSKYQKWAWSFVRADLSQERKEEKEDVAHKTYIAKRNRVFAKYLLNNSELNSTQIMGGLILCKKSEWKWQWAFLEMGTSKYIAGFSPIFKGYEVAVAWMEEEIDNL